MTFELDETLDDENELERHLLERGMIYDILDDAEYERIVHKYFNGIRNIRTPKITHQMA